MGTHARGSLQECSPRPVARNSAPAPPTQTGWQGVTHWTALSPLAVSPLGGDCPTGQTSSYAHMESCSFLLNRILLRQDAVDVEVDAVGPYFDGHGGANAVIDVEVLRGLHLIP